MKDPMDRILRDINAGHLLRADDARWLSIEVIALRKENIKMTILQKELITLQREHDQLIGLLHDKGAPFPPDLLKQLKGVL